MTSPEILQKVKKDEARFFSLQFADLLGVIKEVVKPIAELASALEQGVWFDGSSMEGFARIQESDMFLKPDPDTYAVLPGPKAKTKPSGLSAISTKPMASPIKATRDLF